MLQTRVIKLQCLILTVLMPIERTVSMQMESWRWPNNEPIVDSSGPKITHANEELYHKMSALSRDSADNSKHVNNDDGSQITREIVDVQNEFIILRRVKRNISSINETGKCSDSLTEEDTDIVSPVILTAMFIAGVVTNGVLVIIYARHEEMRTPKNTMFINLAVSDLTFLVIFLGVYGIGQLFGMQPVRCLDEVSCRFYVFLLGHAATINPYSIAVISVQRYFGVAKFANPKMELLRRRLTTPKVLLSFIWSLSFLLSIPEAVRSYKYINGVFSCGDPYIDANSIFILIVFAIVPITIITVFWIITARLLSRKSEAFRRARLRGARVLVAFTIVFIFTYIPGIMCNFIARYTQLNESSKMFCYVTRNLLPMNSVINPIALCVVSRRFRSYFKHYLLCRWCKEVNHPADMEEESTYETHL